MAEVQTRGCVSKLGLIEEAGCNNAFTEVGHNIERVALSKVNTKED